MSLSHLGTDWHDQWERVRRWQSRIRAIGSALPAQEPEKTLALDDVFAFFMNCYHLRDWVMRSGARTPNEVKAFIDGSAPMLVCQDICNGFKHYRLDPARRTTSDADWTTATRPADPVVVAGGLSSRKVGGQRGQRWVFETDGGDRDMFELADDCVEAWRKFLGL